MLWKSVAADLLSQPPPPPPPPLQAHPPTPQPARLTANVAHSSLTPRPPHLVEHSRRQPSSETKKKLHPRGVLKKDDRFAVNNILTMGRDTAIYSHTKMSNI